MTDKQFDIQGAVFTSETKESKAGKPYMGGVLETKEGIKYNLYCYNRESKAGKPYISIIGNRQRDIPEDNPLPAFS